MRAHEAVLGAARSIGDEAVSVLLPPHIQAPTGSALAFAIGRARLPDQKGTEIASAGLARFCGFAPRAVPR